VSKIGLPEILLQNLDIWENIFSKMLAKKEELESSKIWEVDTRGEPTRLAVIPAFQELAQVLGTDVALELEQWVKCHFYCIEFEVAIWEWNRILYHACHAVPVNSLRRKIEPPNVLIKLKSQLLDILDYDNNPIFSEIRKNAPLTTLIIDGDREVITTCSESTLLIKATRQTSQFQALQTIAANSTNEEKQEVVAWSIAQAQVWFPPIKIEKLCGDKYLRTDLLFPDDPSIFGLKDAS
jgi:hypothetical protein